MVANIFVLIRIDFSFVSVSRDTCFVAMERFVLVSVSRSGDKRYWV